MDLLWNEDCDEECDKEECMMYSSGDTNFDSVDYMSWGDGLYYAADYWHCPYNISTDDYLACNASTAAESMYLDPNVPEDSYNLCDGDSGWIGDQLCDDSCRVDECGNDGGDCADGVMCAEETLCYTVYTYWTVFATTPNVNHSYICGHRWLLIQEAMGLEAPEECEYYMELYDYNGDEKMNFRETVPFVYSGVGRDFVETPRGPQINCSLCIGMDLYNI